MGSCFSKSNKDVKKNEKIDENESKCVCKTVKNIDGKNVVTCSTKMLNEDGKLVIKKCCNPQTEIRKDGKCVPKPAPPPKIQFKNNLKK